MITATGMEGGPIYASASALRDSIDHRGVATLVVDLHPDLAPADVASRLRRRRERDSTSTTLRRTLGLPPVAVAWLREVAPGRLPADAATLAALIKAVPVTINALSPIDRAISSAGGVAFDEVDERFMLRRRPGTFVAGEMLDWDAPTGGYLLQACFSTAVAAARACLQHFSAAPDQPQSLSKGKD